MKIMFSLEFSVIFRKRFERLLKNDSSKMLRCRWHFWRAETPDKTTLPQTHYCKTSEYLSLLWRNQRRALYPSRDYAIDIERTTAPACERGDTRSSRVAATVDIVYRFCTVSHWTTSTHVNRIINLFYLHVYSSPNRLPSLIRNQTLLIIRLLSHTPYMYNGVCIIQGVRYRYTEWYTQHLCYGYFTIKIIEIEENVKFKSSLIRII